MCNCPLCRLSVEFDLKENMRFSSDAHARFLSLLTEYRYRELDELNALKSQLKDALGRSLDAARDRDHYEAELAALQKLARELAVELAQAQEFLSEDIDHQLLSERAHAYQVEADLRALLERQEVKVLLEKISKEKSRET